MYINPNQHPSGAYNALLFNSAPGLLVFPDHLMADFQDYNGFVTLTVEDNTVTAVTPNTEAWEAWKNNLTEPEPTVEDLKAELDRTDYKINKCMEYQLVGLDLPYDIIELHAYRQAMRDRINELEQNHE